MKKKIIRWLLKILGHDADKVNVITISVDADEAIKTLKKIEHQLEEINKGIDKLPKSVASLNVRK